MELSETTKKITIWSALGVVLIVALLAAFIPEFRTVASDIAKAVLAIVPSFVVVK